MRSISNKDSERLPEKATFTDPGFRNFQDVPRDRLLTESEAVLKLIDHEIGDNDDVDYNEDEPLLVGPYK